MLKCKPISINKIKIEEQSDLDKFINSHPSLFSKVDDIINSARNEIEEILLRVGINLLKNKSGEYQYEETNDPKINSLLQLHHDCDNIKCFYESGLTEKAIIKAYIVGRELMELILSEHIQIPSGPRTAAEDPIEIGKMIDEYYEQSLPEEGSEKFAAGAAYKKIKKYWEDKYPDKSMNPVPKKNALRGYWKLYKKSIEK